MNDSVSDLQLAKMNLTEFKLEFQSLICERNENIHTTKRGEGGVEEGYDRGNGGGWGQSSLTEMMKSQ